MPTAAPTTGTSVSLASVPCQLTADTVSAPMPAGSSVASSTHANGVVPVDVPNEADCGNLPLLGAEALGLLLEPADGFELADRPEFGLVNGPAARSGAETASTARAVPASTQIQDRRLIALTSTLTSR